MAAKKKVSNPGRRSAQALRRELVEKALALLERRIDNDKLNCSLADLIRLLEVARDLDREHTERVIVEFVEPWDHPLSQDKIQSRKQAPVPDQIHVQA